MSDPFMFTDHESAVKVGHGVAMAVAVRRFRDEYRWTADQVRRVSAKLAARLRDRMDGEIDAIAKDLSRMEALGQSEENMRQCVIAAFALVGAQVSESFEMARRAERN